MTKNETITTRRYTSYSEIQPEVDRIYAAQMKDESKTTTEAECFV